MLSNTNWLFGPLERPSEAATRWGAAVNLAAFDGALGVFVAALCGMRNLNSLPRRCHVLFGLEFSAVRIKEHDA